MFFFVQFIVYLLFIIFLQEIFIQDHNTGNCISYLLLQEIFIQDHNAGKVATDKAHFDWILQSRNNFHRSKCFPLYSFILAMNFTTVDYFSLDIEGAEYKVLSSIPWDKVNIRVSVNRFTFFTLLTKIRI